jgi:hypothetical protein
VRPQVLCKFKISRCWVLNPRTSGLWPSALTTRLPRSITFLTSPRSNRSSISELLSGWSSISELLSGWRDSVGANKVSRVERECFRCCRLDEIAVVTASTKWVHRSIPRSWASSRARDVLQEGVHSASVIRFRICAGNHG